MARLTCYHFSTELLSTKLDRGASRRQADCSIIADLVDDLNYEVVRGVIAVAEF